MKDVLSAFAGVLTVVFIIVVLSFLFSGNPSIFMLAQSKVAAMLSTK